MPPIKPAAINPIAPIDFYVFDAIEDKIDELSSYVEEMMWGDNEDFTGLDRVEWFTKIEQLSKDAVKSNIKLLVLGMSTECPEHFNVMIIKDNCVDKVQDFLTSVSNNTTIKENNIDRLFVV